MLEIIRALKETRVFKISPSERDFEERLVAAVEDYRFSLLQLLERIACDSDRRDISTVVSLLDNFLETRELPYLLLALELACEYGIWIHSSLTYLVEELWKKVKQELED